VKPGLAIAIAVAFAALVAGMVLLGPELLDAVAGKPEVPAPVPFKKSDFGGAGAAAPLSANGIDAGTVVEAPTPPPPEEPKPARVVKAPPVGYLTLTTVPPGIAVLHKGQELGKTPLAKVPMPIGKQAVALDHKGKRKNLMLTVREGKEQKLTLKWDKLK
jgi:hypothetical protein